MSRSLISLGHLVQGHLLSRAGRALDRERRRRSRRSRFSRRPDQHDVDRDPDRSAPVGVAAEHAGVRLGRQVADAVLLAVERRTRTGARGAAWTSTRMPCGPRNSSSSSIRARIRRSRSSSNSANRTGPVAFRCCPRPGSAAVSAGCGQELDDAVHQPGKVVADGAARGRSRRPAASARRASAPSAGWSCRPGGAARRRRSRPPRPTARPPSRADVVGRGGDPGEVLEQRLRLLDVDRVVARQLERDLQHVLAVQRHPGGAVGLVDAGRRPAAARCGRTRRCCPGRGSRPGRCCGRRRPCGSATS